MYRQRYFGSELLVRLAMANGNASALRRDVLEGAGAIADPSVLCVLPFVDGRNVVLSQRQEELLGALRVDVGSLDIVCLLGRRHHHLAICDFLGGRDCHCRDFTNLVFS